MEAHVGRGPLVCCLMLGGPIAVKAMANAPHFETSRTDVFCTRMVPGHKHPRTCFATMGDAVELSRPVTTSYLFVGGSPENQRRMPRKPQRDDVDDERSHRTRMQAFKRAAQGFHTDISRAYNSVYTKGSELTEEERRQLLSRSVGNLMSSDNRPNVQRAALGLASRTLASFGGGYHGVWAWFKCRVAFAGRFGGTTIAKALSPWANSRLDALKRVAGIPTPRPDPGSAAHARMTRGTQLQGDAAKLYEALYGGIVRETPRGESGGYMVMGEDCMLNASPDFFWWNTKKFPHWRQLQSTEEEAKKETTLPSVVASAEYTPQPFLSMGCELRRQRQMRATFGHLVGPTPPKSETKKVGKEACFMIEGSACAPGEIKVPTYVYKRPSWEHILQMNVNMLLLGKPFVVYVVLYTIKLLPPFAVDTMVKKGCLYAFITKLNLWKVLLNYNPLIKYNEDMQGILRAQGKTSLADLTVADLKSVLLKEHVAAAMKAMLKALASNSKDAPKQFSSGCIDVFRVYSDHALQLVIYDFVRVSTPIALLYRQAADSLRKTEESIIKLRNKALELSAEALDKRQRKLLRSHASAMKDMMHLQKRWVDICNMFRKDAARVAVDSEGAERGRGAQSARQHRRRVNANGSTQTLVHRVPAPNLL